MSNPYGPNPFGPSPYVPNPFATPKKEGRRDHLPWNRDHLPEPAPGEDRPWWQEPGSGR